MPPVSSGSDLERPLERLVRGERGEDALLVDQAEQARRLVRDRVQERPLPLARLCLLVAGRDVDPARDDRSRPAVLVGDGRGVPVDDAALSPRVDERVLVLGLRVVGGGGREEGDDLVALERVDEDVPELAAADLLLVVLARHLDRGEVLVQDRAVEIEVEEEARRRVDEGDEEVELRAEVGLQARVLERQPGGRGDEVDRVGLLGEGRIVDEGGDASAVALDRRHGAVGRRVRLVDLASLLVHPALAVAEPVDDLERRVVERLGDRVAERHAGVEREEEPGRRGAVEAAAQHAGQERDRDEREREQEEDPEDREGDMRELVGDDRGEEEDERDAAGAVDGRSVRRLVTDARRQRPTSVAAMSASTATITIVQTTVTTSAAVRRRSRRSRCPGTTCTGTTAMLVDERDDEVSADRCDAADGDEPDVAPLEAPVRISEDQRRE